MTMTSIFLGLALLAGWGLGQDQPQLEKKVIVPNGECWNRNRTLPTRIGHAENWRLQIRKKVFFCGDDGSLVLKTGVHQPCLGYQMNAIAETAMNFDEVVIVTAVFFLPDHERVDVYCDMQTDGGGWTVFQRRGNGSVDFTRNWADYKDGFGELDGEHWLGNDKLSLLTRGKTLTLRVDMEDFEGEHRYAVYDSFAVADSLDNYKLSLGDYNGTAGNSMGDHNDQQFSTPDQDNDIRNINCAQKWKSGWWFKNCFQANLNGLYKVPPFITHADGITWQQWHGFYYSLKGTEMKFRPSLAG